VQKQLGTWNRTRGIWETEAQDLLSEHSEPYSETWPTSGMTRTGQAYELPTPEPRTHASESSLLRTPMAAEADGGPLHPDTARQRGQTLRLTGQVLAQMGHLKAPATPLLPTPAAMAPNDGEQPETWLARRDRVKAKGINGNGMGMPLAITTVLLQRGDHSQLPSLGGKR
jgi:hypothetical protein